MTPPESTVWECHGTGTSLGDPIEVGAVRKVQIKMPRAEPLMVSTSKSNIGHLEGSAAIVAMCKCIMTVIMTKCAPTLHFKTLNPHLDHAKFDAIFCTETNPYKYKQGHCQVSSFGVGGANGHAIFWGTCRDADKQDFSAAFLRRLFETPPPIIVEGRNPADWGYAGLPTMSDEDVKLQIVITKDPYTDQLEISYEQIDKPVEAVKPRAVEGEGWEEEQEEQDFEEASYSIFGSYNDWEEDRMIEGDVPRSYTSTVEIPEEGSLDFAIIKDGDPEQCFGPEEQASTSRIGKVVGPVPSSQRKSWRISGRPEDIYRVEFLVPRKGPPLVTWIQEAAGDGAGSGNDEE